MPAPKYDLAAIFGVEDMVTPRSPSSDTEKERNSKTPYQLSRDVITLMEEIDKCVEDGDLPGVIKRLESAHECIIIMDAVAKDLQKKLR